MIERKYLRDKLCGHRTREENELINEILHILLGAEVNVRPCKFTLGNPTDKQAKEQGFQWRKPKRCRRIILLLYRHVILLKRE
jgi:hypothetical protein